MYTIAQVFQPCSCSKQSSTDQLVTAPLRGQPGTGGQSEADGKSEVGGTEPRDLEPGRREHDLTQINHDHIRLLSDTQTMDDAAASYYGGVFNSKF